MSDRGKWLLDLERDSVDSTVDGLVRVAGYKREGRPPEEVAIMEKAEAYCAHSVFFEAGRNGRPPVAQAFVFISDGPEIDPDFGALHKRLWSWGGVPLIYRKTPGLVQLFRCAHEPDFVGDNGKIVCNPIRQLKIAATIADDEAWWDATRLRNGTLWDDPAVCRLMLSASRAAHKRLVDAVEDLNRDLSERGILRQHLSRKLLILSLLIAYLEERGVFPIGYFGQFLEGATRFFQVLSDGRALVDLLDNLEERFNGNVFVLDESDRASLRTSSQLARFAKFIEAHEEPGGQLTLWQLYSFKDLPVELISHIYQLFVHDSSTAVYTPPFLVRLVLEEALSWERLDRLADRDEVILDPACGSGVFLVEAYKRLVLHWRSRHQWRRPEKSDLRRLLKKIHGIDLEEGAVELAAFSLCLALCDALEPEEIRASIKLFPPLAGQTLHQACFFEAIERQLLTEPVGVVIGNPPFKSDLKTAGAKRSYEQYRQEYGILPDRQLAYLFLHEAMKLLAQDGVLSMLQQSNFLYNKLSLEFRHQFFSTWDVREILDFVSVRGLFHKGRADTKVIVIVASAAPPAADRKILHATFRRSGRIDAEQGFDIDYYDLHWLPRKLVLGNDSVWRTNLLGGGRILAFVDRLKSFRTLEKYAEDQGWEFGEGFIVGRNGNLVEGRHITGKELLPSVALSETGIDRQQITTVEETHFKSAYTSARFTPPMLLIREHMNLQHDVWEDHYLTYKAQVVGFCAPNDQRDRVRQLGAWLAAAKRPLQAFVAAISPSLFSRRATAVCADEIMALPYPEDGTLSLSENEKIIVDDVVDYQRDLIRLGENSVAMRKSGHDALSRFTEVFTRQISAIYKENPLRALDAHTWPGFICQPFVFGNGEVDWDDADELQDKLDGLLRQDNGATLYVTRIARIYDGSFIFLLKSDRLRFWLPSVALRDSDETLADLRAQGF